MTLTTSNGESTELAEGIGGFAVFNTNNFKKNMERIMEEVRTHYEISYVPKSTLYDGKYQKIKVTVNEPHLTVHTRDGYFALPELNGEALQPFETSALHILDGGPRQDFAFHAAPLRFKPLHDGYHFEMSFDVPVADLATGVDQNTHKARVQSSWRFSRTPADKWWQRSVGRLTARCRLPNWRGSGAAKRS